MASNMRYLTVPIKESDLKISQEFLRERFETLEIKITPDDHMTLVSLRQALFNFLEMIRDYDENKEKIM